MNISRKMTSLVTAAALVATTMGPLATSASAEGWHGRRGGPSYAHSQHKGSRHYHQRSYARRHHHDNTGKYVAIGVGALMLGIIAAEASRR
jgi:hypothetical protein